MHCKDVYSKEVFGKCVYLIWFVFVSVVGNQGYVSRKCIHWKIFEQIGIGKAYLHVFLMTMREIDSYSCRGVFRTLLNIYDWAPS